MPERIKPALSRDSGRSVEVRMQTAGKGCPTLVTLLGKGAGIGNDSECVHLKAIVVVESERLLDLYSRIKLEPCSLKAVTAPGMAAVENRHVILFGHCVDRIEKAEEILLRVDVLFAVSAQQDVVPLLESESLVYIGCLDLGKVLMEHLGHG